MFECKVGGISFRFTFLFFAVITVFLLMDQNGFAFWGFLAAIIHECAHIIIFILFQNKPKKVIFEVSGIRIIKNNKYISYWKEALTIAAGPFTNLLVAFFLFKYNQYSLFAYIHLGIGLFNLLPVKTLDGGQILQLCLLTKHDVQKTDRIMLKISIFVLIPILICGVYMALFGNYNFTLLITGIYLLITLLK